MAANENGIQAKLAAKTHQPKIWILGKFFYIVCALGSSEGVCRDFLTIYIASHTAVSFNIMPRHFKRVFASDANFFGKPNFLAGHA